MGFPPTHRGHQYRGRNISLPMHPPGTRAGLSRPQLKPPGHTANNNHTTSNHLAPHPNHLAHHPSNNVVFALTVAPRCSVQPSNSSNLQPRLVYPGVLHSLSQTATPRFCDHAGRCSTKPSLTAATLPKHQPARDEILPSQRDTPVVETRSKPQGALPSRVSSTSVPNRCGSCVQSSCNSTKPDPDVSLRPLVLYTRS